MWVVVPRALDIVSPSPSPAHPPCSPAGQPLSSDQLCHADDMERNYAFAMLPSYLRYTRRETIKTDVAKDTTAYANIRQKISSTSLTVPYEKGLDTLRALQRSNHTSSLELGSILKLQKRRTDTITNNKISTKHITNDIYPPGRRSPRTRLGSEGGSSVKSTDSKLSQKKAIRSRPPIRRDRMGSETSSTASRSRPTSYSSYSSWYTDDSLWSDKIDEIKERYADNSDFITTMRRDKADYFRENDLTPKPDVDVASFQFKVKHSKKKLPKLKKGGFLPPIPMHIEEQNCADGSWSSHTTGSSKSTVSGNFLAKHSHKQHNYIPKSRKVEFNLQPKRPVKLPSIPSKGEVKVPKKPKSILKKIDDALDDLPPTPSPTSRYYPGEEVAGHVSGGWQVHIARLRSPVPHERRKPTSFRRQPLKVKCSKEFETAAIDIQSDKNET